MPVTDAVKIIKEKYPDMSIIECLDFPNFYGFALTAKGMEDEAFGGAYDTVSKVDGTVDVFNPIDDLTLFRKAKKIQFN